MQVLIKSRHLISFNLSVGLLLVLEILASNCSQSDTKQGFVVVYASEGSQYNREGQDRALKRGMVLYKGDTVITGQGLVDLQSLQGSLVRIQANSRVIVQELGKKESVNLSEGSMIARIDRQTSDHEFEASNPTLIAGVRGTTFKVEQDGIQVLDGKVAVKPRAEILAPKNDSSPAELEKARIQADQNEQVLESGQTARLAVEFNPNLPQASQDNTPKSRSMSNAKQSEASQALEVTSQSLTIRDQAEAQTLVGLSAETLAEIAKNPHVQGDPATAKAAEIDSQLSEKIKKEYEQNLDQALDKLEKSTLATVDIKNNDDIIKNYEIIESVHLHNGAGTHIGAVVAQAGDLLIVHTPKGIVRLSINDVSYIDYQ